mmetsp:Transcript_23503/g.59567  ORF Transcript_23503/g.59567 Transcript_23503/m.59567 type:complete len:251 (+) Transcript_23503:368-1120(+)
MWELSAAAGRAGPVYAAAAADCKGAGCVRVQHGRRAALRRAATRRRLRALGSRRATGRRQLGRRGGGRPGRWLAAECARGLRRARHTRERRGPAAARATNLGARGGAGRQNVGQESFGLARERHRVAGRAAVAARARPRRRVWRARRVRRVCVRLRRGGVRGRTIRGADGRGASVGGGQQIRRGSGAERRDGGHAHPHPALGRRAGGRVRESRGRTGRRNVGGSLRALYRGGPARPRVRALALHSGRGRV